MRRFYKQSIIAFSLVSLLGACGGGGADDSGSTSLPDYTGNQGAGTFKDAYQTGVFYSHENAPQRYGQNGRHCAQNANTRYFETVDALIFGSSHLPESDFQQAAKWVESAFTAASALMLTPEHDYFQNRNKYSPEIMRRMFTEMANSIEKERMLQERHYVWAELLTEGKALDSESYNYMVNGLLDSVYVSNGKLNSYASGFVAYLPENYIALDNDGKLAAILNAIEAVAKVEANNPVTSSWITNLDLPHDFDLWSERSIYLDSSLQTNNVLENYLYQAFKQLSDSEQKNFITLGLQKLAERGYAPVSYDEITYKNKLYVCLSEKASDIGWGEGTDLGITFTAPSIYQRKNAEQIILHEMIHTIQAAHTTSPEMFSLIPRWMSEGQAVYLSGQTVAKPSSHSNYDPLSVVAFSDEYGDSGEAYQHYGLAYSYIQENNGVEGVNAFYKSLSHVYDDMPKLSGTSYLSITFENNFGEYFKDHLGNKLSYSRFEQDYSALMSSWK